MREINRSIIILLAALVIIGMAMIIFLAWAAPDETIDRLGDLVQYFDAHNDNPGRLILTLGALTVIVLAVLTLVIEVAPQEQAGELKVKQAGSTTIVSSEGIRQRLEEALLGEPSITTAKVRVASHSDGVGTTLNLTLAAGSNVANATEEATRIVTQTLEEEMGLPAAPPRIRVAFSPVPVAASTPSTTGPSEVSEGPSGGSPSDVEPTSAESTPIQPSSEGPGEPESRPDTES